MTPERNGWDVLKSLERKARVSVALDCFINNNVDGFWRAMNKLWDDDRRAEAERSRPECASVCDLMPCSSVPQREGLYRVTQRCRGCGGKYPCGCLEESEWVFELADSPIDRVLTRVKEEAEGMTDGETDEIYYGDDPRGENQLRFLAACIYRLAREEK